MISRLPGQLPIFGGDSDEPPALGATDIAVVMGITTGGLMVGAGGYLIAKT